MACALLFRAGKFSLVLAGPLLRCQRILLRHRCARDALECYIQRERRCGEFIIEDLYRATPRRLQMNARNMMQYPASKRGRPTEAKPGAACAPLGSKHERVTNKFDASSSNLVALSKFSANNIAPMIARCSSQRTFIHLVRQGFDASVIRKDYAEPCTKIAHLCLRIWAEPWHRRPTILLAKREIKNGQCQLQALVTPNPSQQKVK